MQNKSEDSNRINLEAKNKHDNLEEVAIKFETQADSIVVKKIFFVSKIFELSMDFIYRVGKLLFWVVICILLSIGVNAIVNPQIRGIIFSYFTF
ncbi:MAG: hypothetical protein ACERKZ_21270 [Lachnotalea sp.]